MDVLARLDLINRARQALSGPDVLRDQIAEVVRNITGSVGFIPTECAVAAGDFLPEESAIFNPSASTIFQVGD
jgi:hypothetical protein